MPEGVWRRPSEETSGLYPKLVVSDGRVGGSITVDASRLPIWALLWSAIHRDWAAVEQNWYPTQHYGYTAEDLSQFLGNLLEQRGELARLLLILADNERQANEANEQATGLDDWWSWWENADLRQRAVDQLRRCLAVLEG